MAKGHGGGGAARRKKRVTMLPGKRECRLAEERRTDRKKGEGATLESYIPSLRWKKKSWRRWGWRKKGGESGRRTKPEEKTYPRCSRRTRNREAVFLAGGFARKSTAHISREKTRADARERLCVGKVNRTGGKQELTGKDGTRWGSLFSIEEAWKEEKQSSKRK